MSDKIYKVFGLSALLRGGTVSEDIEKDLFRTLFFGSRENCQYHINTWLDGKKSEYSHYSQGNMSAGNLFFIFGVEPFSKEAEDPASYYTNNVHLHFAFVDQNNILSGLSLYYRRDDPKKWMIGLIKHTNLAPANRKVFILTCVNPEPFIKDRKHRAGDLISVTEATVFASLLEEPLLAHLFKLVVMPGSKLNIDLEVIGQFLQNVGLRDDYQDNTELLAILKKSPISILSNKALQVTQRLQLKLSIPQIFTCLDETSLLYQNINYLSQFTVTKARRLISLLLLLDRAGFIKQWNTVMQNKLLAKHLFAVSNNLQASFLKYAFSKEFHPSLIFLINNNEFAFFYEKINKTEKNVENIWRNLAWIAQLDWKLPKESFKQAFLCKLIFYINDISSLQNLNTVLQEKHAKFDTIFTPDELAQFVTDGFYLSHLSWPNIINLAALCKNKEQARACHNLLKVGVDFSTMSFYLTAPQLLPIVNNLAMFEPNKQMIFNALEFLKTRPDLTRDSTLFQIIGMLNLSERSITPFLWDDLKTEQLFQVTKLIKKQEAPLQPLLMKTAYAAITAGFVKPEQAEFNLLRKNLNTFFLYQFISSLKIMNFLEILQPANSKEMVELLSQTNKEKALFVKVINALEYECHKIRTRLRQELPDKLKEIEQEEINYRKKMYSIIFNQINHPTKEKDLIMEMKAAEQSFLTVANIEHHPWLRYTLAAITNFVTLVLTAGLANFYHYKHSGDVFFFQHTVSSEAIKTLDISIIEQLKPILII